MAAAVLMLELLYRKKMKSKKISMQKKSTTKRKPKIAKEERICRVCLKEGEISIFDEGSSENTVEYIKLFAGIALDKEDNLPKYLCGNCNNLLCSAILFRQRAREADTKLRHSGDKEVFKYEVIPKHEVDISVADTSYEDEAADNEPNWMNYDEVKDDIEYKCRKCQIEFSNCNEYIVHLHSELHKRARIPCPVCNISFVASYLHIHISRAHSAEKPFVCEICGKSFSVRVAFKRHLYIHSDELPYKCPECPYKGRFSESLKGHMRIHTGEKPYACHQCAAQFVCASNLKKHMRTHQAHYEFKCEQCERGFHSQVKMMEHMRVDHTGLREHQCDTCGKFFGYRKQLMKHTRKVHQRPKMRQGKLPLYLQLQDKQSSPGNT